MRIKNYIIAIIFLAVAGSLILYDRHAQKVREADDSEGRELVVLDLSENDVTQFIYSLAQLDTDTLDKTSSSHSLIIEAHSDVLENPQSTDNKSHTTSNWMLKSPIEFPAQNDTISRLLSAFLSYRYDNVFAVTDNKLAQFGISTHSSTSLKLWTQSSDPKFQQFSYLVGKDAPVGFKMYLATSFRPGHVYFGPRSSVLNQQFTLKDFMDLSIPSFSFEPGDSLSFSNTSKKQSDSLANSAQDTQDSQIVDFQETFTKRQVDNSLFADSNDDDADQTASAENEDDRSTTQDEAAPIRLSQYPEKSDMVSSEALETLGDVINNLTATELGYDLNDQTQKQLIADSPHRLMITLTPKGSNSENSFVFYKVNDQIYFKKYEHFLLLDSQSLSPYFSMVLEDFLVHPLPLSLTQKSLDSISITSHKHEDDDPGHQKNYTLMKNQWITQSTDGDKTPKETAKNTTDNQGVELTEIDLSADLDKPYELSANITQFISDLYSSHYHMKASKIPDLDYELTYTLGMNSSALNDIWEIYTSPNNHDEIWMKHQKDNTDPSSSDTYYFLKSPLLDDLNEPYFDHHAINPPDQESDNTNHQQSSESEADFNAHKAVNFKENLAPQINQSDDKSSSENPSE